MPNISIDDVVFNTVDIASLRMGERLKLTANRLRLTAQDMADACDCKAITIKTYWGDHNKMPKLSYIQSLLKTFPRYDAYLLGLSACLPGESEGDISYRFRAVNQWLRVSEQVESIADYYDAGKGNTGLTDGMVSKIEAGEAQMPVSALRNLAITQGKQQAALYILGLSDSIQ
jgi:transcriptional regulator with XRE-family HTH domain